MMDDPMAEIRRLKEALAAQRRLVNALNRDLSVMKEALLGLRRAVDTRLEELRPEIRILRPVEGMKDSQVKRALEKAS
jgi:hypothetical protein